MTAYLGGVQERLRRAELARAAEEARTLEARKTAQAERWARRFQAGLAASILALTTAGGVGFTYWLLGARPTPLGSSGCCPRRASSATRRVPHPSISPRGRRPATPWASPLRMQATRAC